MCNDIVKPHLEVVPQQSVEEGDGRGVLPVPGAVLKVSLVLMHHIAATGILLLTLEAPLLWGHERSKGKNFTERCVLVNMP